MLAIILSSIAAYFILGIFIIIGLCKLDKCSIYVRDLPNIFFMTLVWPVVSIIWIVLTIGEKWGDKRIL